MDSAGRGPSHCPEIVKDSRQTLKGGGWGGGGNVGKTEEGG